MNGTETVVDTVVIGGGQSGLALGYHLARQGRDFVILDAKPRPGDGWRDRWDSLRLFTPGYVNCLPGRDFPGDRLGFPTKDEVADFLEAYARDFGLPLQNGTRVERVHRDGEDLVVTAGPRSWRAANVVVATGGEQTPRTPAFAVDLDPGIVQMHSADYRSPAQLADGPVLVVGRGNSGAEIAKELCAGHESSVAGLATLLIRFRHGRTAARFAFPLIAFAGRHVLTLSNPLGRRVVPKIKEGGAPLIRTKSAELAAAGVAFAPRIVGMEHGRPVDAEGTVHEPANVIWCTGFRTDFSWIDLPSVHDGALPEQDRGVVAAEPGLYFLGQPFQRGPASGTFGTVSADARYVARRIAGRSNARRASLSAA